MEVLAKVTFNLLCEYFTIVARIVLFTLPFYSAIISDITSPENRSKALAHVGIAFAICFIIGPPIGAYFASQPPPRALTAGGIELNIYAVPAMITLALLIVETIFLALFLPETRRVSASSAPKVKPEHTTGDAKQSERSPTERINLLALLGNIHFMFLGLFSGVEFTLTFLTFDRMS